MSSVTRSHTYALAGLVILCFAPAIHADDSIGLVNGKISVDGKPLSTGRIFFLLANDQFIGAKVKEGAFKIDRIPVGGYTVAIEFEGVPAKYSEESELAVEVRRGTNQFEFDLRSN